MWLAFNWLLLHPPGRDPTDLYPTPKWLTNFFWGSLFSKVWFVLFWWQPTFITAARRTKGWATVSSSNFLFSRGQNIFKVLRLQGKLIITPLNNPPRKPPLNHKLHKFIPLFSQLHRNFHNPIPFCRRSKSLQLFYASVFPLYQMYYCLVLYIPVKQKCMWFVKLKNRVSTTQF